MVFKANARAFAGFGVYVDPVKLVKGMAVDEHVATALDMDHLERGPLPRAQMGLRPERVGRGIDGARRARQGDVRRDGKREALYAVIRRFPKDARSLAAITGTARSWMLPSQVADRRGALEPGTWILTETDSSIALSLGVQVRLRLQLGARGEGVGPRR